MEVHGTAGFALAGRGDQDRRLGEGGSERQGQADQIAGRGQRGLRAQGLDQVKGELAWADTGGGKDSTYVFRVPANAKGATISFGGDWEIGWFAHYYYGDHKPPKP